MYYNFLNKYIPMLKKEDIINYANKQNIFLTPNEIETIYKVIKTRWKEIYKDGISVINEYRKEFNDITFNKIKELYLEIKNKYLK